MSVNSLLYSNRLNLNAGTINLAGIISGGNLIAPVITSSNVVCSNLKTEFWNGGWDANITVGDILVCGNAVTNTFVRLPIGADGAVLTANSSVTLGIEWV